MKFVKPDMNPEYFTESREALWDLLAIKGRKPATVQTWVNRDGTNGAIKVVVGTLNGDVEDITWHVARVLDSRVCGNDTFFLVCDQQESCRMLWRRTDDR